jgi:CpeT/CpcT family (DUF1001)
MDSRVHHRVFRPARSAAECSGSLRPAGKLGAALNKCSVLILGLIAAACLTGCAAAARQKEHEAALLRLSHWLPGNYDNAAQAKADVQKGIRPPHDAVELDIALVDSISIGRNVFYMQETAADDPLRVLSQRVVIFTATDKGIVESINTLDDPLRWRNGWRNPEIFEGMTPRDFKAADGCDITWKLEEQPVDKNAAKPSKEEAERAAAKRRLIGTNDRKRCQMTSHAAIGLVQVELRGEIAPNEISLAELQYDQDDKLIQGNPAEPFYRFRRMGK